MLISVIRQDRCRILDDSYSVISEIIGVMFASFLLCLIVNTTNTYLWLRWRNGFKIKCV